jgi:hypothetical protein
MSSRALLHKSMIAASGKYRIDGSSFVFTVDVSWNESWNGAEQRRYFRIDGDKLIVEGGMDRPPHGGNVPTLRHACA